MALVKFSNGNRSSALNPWVNDVFENFFNDSFLSDRLVSRVPAVNISETNDEYHIELAVPGMSKDDFKINLEKDVLSISAQKTEENTDESKNYNRREYSYNSFVRSFNLPDSVDQQNIDASYDNGILKIDVAKREEAKNESRMIEIR